MKIYTKLLKFRILMIIVSISFFAIDCFSQDNKLDDIIYQNFDPLQLVSDDIFENESVSIPPLQTLIDSALIYSPLLQQQRILVEIKEIEFSRSKMEWTNYIGTVSDIKYGSITQTNYDNEVLQQDIIDASRYSLGFSLRITLFDIIKRKKEILIAQKQIDFANSKKDEVEKKIKEDLIVKYYTLLLKQRLLTIKNEIHEVQAVNYLLAEKEFLEGEINMSDYAGIVELTAKSSEGVENSRIEFKIAYFLLEQAVGRSISEIKKAIDTK